MNPEIHLNSTRTHTNTKHLKLQSQFMLFLGENTHTHKIHNLRHNQDYTIHTYTDTHTHSPQLIGNDENKIKRTVFVLILVELYACRI